MTLSMKTTIKSERLFERNAARLLIVVVVVLFLSLSLSLARARVRIFFVKKKKRGGVDF
jgi:hypothetical protein